MKRSFYAVAAFLASITACQQEAVTPSTTGIIGEWNWVSCTGGFSGKENLTPATTGTTIKWLFKTDSTVQMYTTKQGVLQPTETGVFSLGTTRSIYSGQPARSLTIRRMQPEIYVIKSLGSQLVLQDNYPDGFERIFQR
ncbi:MAG: hypothetical protein ACRYFX_14815 [Janthinobacterium lividum]